MSNPETLIQNFPWVSWKEDDFLDFLKSMAAKGWVLCGFKKQNPLMMWRPHGYIFKRAESQNLEFRVDYRPVSKKERDTYIQLCEDAGWHLGCAIKGLYVFYTDAKKAAQADFFSDGQSKISKFRRLQIRTMTLGVILIPAMYYLYYHSWLSHHVSVFMDSPFIASMIVLLVIFYLYVLIRFNLVIGRIKNQKNAKEAQSKSTKNRKKWHFWYDVVIIISLTLALTPLFGIWFIPNFHWQWSWYFQNALFVTQWSVFMVLFFAWMSRQGKKKAKKVLEEI